MKLTDKVGEPAASFSLLSKHSGITLSSTIKVASSIMLNVFYHFHVFCVKEECQSQTKVFTCKTEMFSLYASKQIEMIYSNLKNCCMRECFIFPDKCQFSLEGVRGLFFIREQSEKLSTKKSFLDSS